MHMVRVLLSQRRIYRVLLNSIRYFLTFNKIFSKCFRVLPRWIRLSWNNRRKWMVLYSFNITNSTKWGNTWCYELEKGFLMGRQLCSSGLMGSSIAWTRTNRKYGSNENGWCFRSSYCRASMFHTDRMQVQNARFSVRGYDVWGLQVSLLISFTVNVFNTHHLSDMKINFYIGDDGFIYEGRGINFIGGHW